MVLLQQVTAMIEFLECQRELALGHCSRTMEGRGLAKRLWAECAQILNSVSPDCPNKSAADWRAFYNEYKSKLIKKIKLQKREMNATGGGPAKKISLTPLQERLYDILGRDIGEPLAGVRHNPLSQTISLPVEIEVASTSVGPSETAHSFSLLENYDNMPIIIDENEISLEQEHPAPPEPPAPIASTPNPESHRPSRRRRQISTRRHVEDSNSALEAAQARLEAVGDRQAEATLEHARATDRLAAAVENIGKLISLATSSPASKKKRHLRIVLSTDSESD